MDVVHQEISSVRLCSNLHYPIVQQDKGYSLLRAEPVVYRAVSIKSDGYPFSIDTRRFAESGTHVLTAFPVRARISAHNIRTILACEPSVLILGTVSKLAPESNTLV